MGLAQELRERYQALWEAMVTHPFVQELGEGTLPLERFQRYFLQDYLYLGALVKATALTVAKAPDLATARPLAAFLNSMLQGEEALFQETFRSWGMAPQHYRNPRPTPLTAAYVDFALRVASEGDFPQAIAFLTVSEWTYLDWATRLSMAGKVPPLEPYRRWIAVHTTPEFAEFVAWLRSTLDQAPRERHPVLEEVFATALRYEWLFWEMAYRDDPWPPLPDVARRTS